MAVVLSKGQTFEDLTCNYICPDNAEPVCGFNGEEYEEFATECELKNANCLLGRIQTKAYKIVEKALCERKKQRNNCLMRPCPMILRPICAFDGKVQKVFDNQCV
uniref:Kazal-like domain-containing protein n=1 Tax=Megaselia scalaris TaxID=36166 RepID=T1GMH9_MEGSC